MVVDILQHPADKNRTNVVFAITIALGTCKKFLIWTRSS